MTAWMVPLCWASTTNRCCSGRSSGSAVSKSMSRKRRGGAMAVWGTVLNRNPYCFVNTTVAVSCRALRCRRSSPPHSVTDVMDSS